MNVTRNMHGFLFSVSLRTKNIYERKYLQCHNFTSHLTCTLMACNMVKNVLLAYYSSTNNSSSLNGKEIFQAL